MITLSKCLPHLCFSAFSFLTCASQHRCVSNTSTTRRTRPQSSPLHRSLCLLPLPPGQLAHTRHTKAETSESGKSRVMMIPPSDIIAFAYSSPVFLSDSATVLFPSVSIHLLGIDVTTKHTAKPAERREERGGRETFEGFLLVVALEAYCICHSFNSLFPLIAPEVEDVGCHLYLVAHSSKCRENVLYFVKCESIVTFFLPARAYTQISHHHHTHQARRSFCNYRLLR